MKTKLLLIFLFMSAIQAFSQTYKKDDKVEIEYSGTWYPGYILETKDNQYKIHYDAYDNSWDEWVPTSRLKPLAGTPTTNTNTKVEEPKSQPQNTKVETTVSTPSTGSGQSQVTYYSFTKDGRPVTTYDCV